MIDRGVSRPSARAAGEPAVHLTYAIGAAAFAAYAVWASLFPFDFHAVPTAVVARLWRDWTTAGGALSWTDLVSNVLLFLPIGLFFAAVVEKIWPGWGKKGRAVFAVFGAGVLLSGGIEFGQTFVSWRTPSNIDVIAEALGTACGIAIWRYVGVELDAVLRAITELVRRSTPIERLLLVYGAAFMVAWWLPADFTLRPFEIDDKYRHKRLLLPFTPSPDAHTPFELALTAAAAVPLGVAALWCGCAPGTRRSVPRGAVAAALFLTALEIVQVPVFSRTTDGTAWLAALAGATVGAIAARWRKAPAVVGFDRAAFRRLVPVGVWFAVTAICEWWPFQFILDPDRARIQTMVWSYAPFRSPAGVLEVVPGAALAALAGVFVGARLSPRFVRLHSLLIAGCGLGVFLLFEIANVVLAGGRPTLVSVLLKEMALLCGIYFGSARAALVPAGAGRKGVVPLFDVINRKKATTPFRDRLIDGR
jgi:hypothetical protein